MLGFLSSRASAAHLAIAAVAPLVLCKYFAADAMCLVLVWLAVISALWAMMSPVRIKDEHSPEARRRFLRRSNRDPFFWVAVVLVVYFAVVALNSGVKLAYDAELKIWRLATPMITMLPGGMSGTGGVYFAASLLVLAVYPSVVHSLDTRQSVYFVIIAALAVLTDAVFANASGIGVRSDSAVAYGLWALAAAGAMFSAERSNRRPKELISALSLAGLLAAMLFTFRSTVIVIFAAALLLLALLFIGFMFRELGLIGVIRALLMLFVAASIAAVVFHWRSGDWQALVPAWWSDSDPLFNKYAVQAFEANPWTGSGVGSFPLVTKMSATVEDWVTLGSIPDFRGSGWRLLLVERGVIGVLAVIVSFGAMSCAWFRYARQRGLGKFAAAVPLLPIAIVAVSVSMVFDSSALQAEAVVAFAALGAFSVNGGQ